jgi:hypothetical protein
MTKTQSIITNIITNYIGWTINTDMKWRLAEENSASMTTVNKAIKQLKSNKVIESNIVTLRQFVHPTEIAATLNDDLLMTDNKVNELAAKFMATDRAVRLGVEYGLRSGVFTRLNGGLYGLMVRKVA